MLPSANLFVNWPAITHTQKKRLEEYVDAKQFAASDVCDSQVISELRRLKFKELTISKFK
jgi:hypothetical protein